jgi:hypothetical protein
MSKVARASGSDRRRGSTGARASASFSQFHLAAGEAGVVGDLAAVRTVAERVSTHIALCYCTYQDMQQVRHTTNQHSSTSGHYRLRLQIAMRAPPAYLRL